MFGGGGAVEPYGAGPDRLAGQGPMTLQLLVRCGFEAQTAPTRTNTPRQNRKLRAKATNCPAKIDTAFASRALETSEITVPCETSGISVVMLYRTLPRMVTPES